MSGIDNRPTEMRALRRWCWHRLEPKPNADKKEPCPKCGKVHFAKVPRHPGGTGASCTNPSEWRDFATVQRVPEGLDGISFVLADGDSLVCADSVPGARR